VCERRASRSLTCSRSDLRCKAAAVESSDSSSGDSALGGTLYLGLLFALWYAANIFFNIWNKQVLKAYNFPITGTFVQFGVGLCIASAMWLFRLKPMPTVRRRRAVSPPTCGSGCARTLRAHRRHAVRRRRHRPSGSRQAPPWLLPRQRPRLTRRARRSTATW
jgi:hypothetical protein